MARLVSSKHLEGINDLTLTAPIKQGFIDAFESVTYETRLRIVMKTLFKMRATAREHSHIKPFVDTAEHIQALLDFRLAILDDVSPPRLLLGATFDRPFEPYMRLIWYPLGPLLDIVFCNCEGYVTASDHSFEEYLAWVRSAQVDSDFFYSASGTTVIDVNYLCEIERLHREGEEDAELKAIRFAARHPVAAAKQVRADPQHLKATNRIGAQALVALHKLTDFYPPDRPTTDGNYLLRAARQLLAGWGRAQLVADVKEWEEVLAEQLHWYETPLPERPSDHDERIAYAPACVQGGILSNYGDDASPVRHGALLLMRVTEQDKARRFLAELPVQPEGVVAPLKGNAFLNLALTRHGLANLGVPAAELAAFPQEFREGMEERAGLLGDLVAAHPRNWRLPPRNWPPRAEGEAARPPVEIAEIDILVQLRTTQDCDGHDATEPSHPLHERIAALAAEAVQNGVELLAVESMRRASRDTGLAARDHFGFVDGLSQPVVRDAATAGAAAGRDAVARGEILLGYANDRADPPSPASPLRDNGTFLVVRKLHQNVAALRGFVARASASLGLGEEEVYGKLMGRSRKGEPLAKPMKGPTNDFDYRGDPQGQLCPFQSHIRRTNPREDVINEENFRPTPRILRRGLSYGPAHRDGETDDPERGIFFMAYNASIAEQFEVIQRWVNSGNSTNVATFQNDPLMGVSPPGAKRTFCFEHKSEVKRIDIPESFVELRWGAYLFVPSMAAIQYIADGLPDEAATRDAVAADDAARGKAVVAGLIATASRGAEGRLAAAAGWKTAIEDFSAKDPAEKNLGAAVWAAVRDYHGGVLRVPYGFPADGKPPEDVILVAGKRLVMSVFENRDSLYSMCGQKDRMRQSFGTIFLGLDGGPEYEKIATQVNSEIMKISAQDTFKLAYTIANGTLDRAFGYFAKLFGTAAGDYDLRRDYITPILARVCAYWFGIPDDEKSAIPGLTEHCRTPHVDGGGWSWLPPDQRRPRCPGDFMATSRYCFYPDPAPAVEAYGREQGQALRAAVTAHFQDLRRLGKYPKAPIAHLLTRIFSSDDEIARTLIGVMTGFLPPTEASIRWTLHDWLEERTLWRHQHSLRAAAGTPYERATEALLPPLKRAMQKRPSPDMLWRTALHDHDLAGVKVKAGDRVFAGIVSAMAEDVMMGVDDDVYPVFGGDRRQAEHAPLHACPAYEFAMGTMLGIFAALLDRVRIETLPGPLLVKISDPGGGSGPAPEPAADAAPSPGPRMS